MVDTSKWRHRRVLAEFAQDRENITLDMFTGIRNGSVSLEEFQQFITKVESTEQDRVERLRSFSRG